MKKKLINCFVIILLISLFSVEVIAAEKHDEHDAVRIDEQSVAKFRNYDSDRIIRIYNGYYMWGFAEGKPIAELLEAPYVLEEVYFIASPKSGEGIYKVERDGVIQTIHMSYDEGKELHDIIMSHEDLMQRFVSSDVEIANLYCLDGEPSHDGIYLYFVTNQGDYVYYKESAFLEEEYLFPVQDFYDFAKVIHEARVKNKDGDGWMRPVEELYDLSSYKIDTSTKESGILVWILLAVVVAILGGHGVLKVLRRKKEQAK